MRAFVAIALPECLHAKLAGVQQALSGAARDARWTRPEGLHLTLKFLGEISSAQSQAVAEALAPISAFEPFTVEVTGFGFFPNTKRPSVFWAGIAAPLALSELASNIDSKLENIGFAREERRFAPHLTLARFRVQHPQPALEAAIAALTYSPLGEFQASEFILFESRLSPRGAQYREVMRFPNRHP